MDQIQHNGAIEGPSQSLQLREDISIRTATIDDIPRICDISASATKKFGSIPELSDLADDAESPKQVQEWLDQGQIYLAVNSSDGKALGFVAAYLVENIIYIGEISVLQECQGRGFGGQLVDIVSQWARKRSLHFGWSKAQVSLKTYADVPWNGPWYRKRGFREIDPATLSLSHVQMIAKDKEKLERPGYRRCCMLWEE